MNQAEGKKSNLVASLILGHFRPIPPTDLMVTERIFPHRVRADLHRAIDRLFRESGHISHFSGVFQGYSHEGLTFSSLILPNSHHPARTAPPEYEEIDIGEDEPVRCLKNGLWLLEGSGSKYGVLLAAENRHGEATGLKLQFAALKNDEGLRITRQFFQDLEEAVHRSKSYRGKVLSLETRDRFSGQARGISVHRLRTVGREDVILPRRTLELLDRNVIGFARRRPQLAGFGLSTKKGILFYGPPGTGKTHTIHYLAGCLEGHTTLLVTAEQVGLLDEYMSLARLLQPSVVVIEDVDLIAGDRAQMRDPCEEVMLNKLLNEMDGLRPDADIFFILTTNRPESLERALASRPGRIDQAIEFPLPDGEGRRKLVHLYAHGLVVPEGVVEEIVKRTENVSASFIKELMRRAAQFRLEREGVSAEVTLKDIDAALEELLFSGGSLNRKLLGAMADPRRDATA